jgi:glycosyltransferase involved in cell wall biosynthesis
LAVGAPVVMTAFADLPDFDGIISVAKDEQAFVQLLQKEVENDTKDKIINRIEFASNNSWDSKADEFDALINNLLKEKNS